MLLVTLLFQAAILVPSWLVLRVCCRSIWDFPLVAVDAAAAFLTATVSLIIRGGKPRFPEWTPALEFVQTIGHRMMSKYGGAMVLEDNAKRIRHLTGIAGSLKGWFACRQYNTTLERVTRNGLQHLWLRSKAPASDAAGDKYTVLYYHGGGYTIASPPMYIAMCNRLRQAIIDAVKTENGKTIEVDVFLANYRKAPEFKYPVPQEDALLAYEYLRVQEKMPANRLIVAGDSAGGGLVLSTLLRLRDGETRDEQPLAAILSFPLMMDVAGDENPQRGEHCILAKSFVHESLKALLPDPSTWKDASGLYRDLNGLAPALIQVGTLDYLYQDSITLFEKAKQDGATEWELDVRSNMPHAFSNLPAEVVPDSTLAIHKMGQFIAKHVATQTKPPQAA